MIKLYNKFVCCFLCFFLFASYGDKKGDVVIINSNKTKNQVQNVAAPVLVPSKSKKLRSAREDAEKETEDAIIQKLEIERMKDEQKRYKTLFSNKKSTPSAIGAKNASLKSRSAFPFYNHWLNRAFVSFGLGTVQYLGVENLNSSGSPAYFFSFGGYGYGNVIFELSLYYSEHYLNPVTHSSQPIPSKTREGLSQPGISMAVKFSPLKGRIKPYAGVVGSLVARRWFIVHKTGEVIGDANPEIDVAAKRWRQSFDAGLTIGADIGLGRKLGLNVSFAYNLNIYTETRDDILHDNVQVLDERDSMVVSGSLRYYL